MPRPRPLETAEPGRALAVPKHLRDARYRGAGRFGHGEGYGYSHDAPVGRSAQAYLPEGRRHYEPVDRGHEAVIRERLEALRRAAQAARAGEKYEGQRPGE